MPIKTRTGVIAELIDRHFEIEPDLVEIYVIESEDQSEHAPIELLEVNAATYPTGSLEAFTFGPSEGVPYRLTLAELTPEELAELMGADRVLPNGWDLSKARQVKRSDRLSKSSANASA